MPAIYALFFMQIFFRMFGQYGTTESSGLAFITAVHIAGALLVFVNEVDVYSKEQKVKGKEIGNFTDAAFHSDGFVSLVD